MYLKLSPLTSINVVLYAIWQNDRKGELALQSRKNDLVDENQFSIMLWFNLVTDRLHVSNISISCMCTGIQLYCYQRPLPGKKRLEPQQQTIWDDLSQMAEQLENGHFSRTITFSQILKFDNFYKTRFGLVGF